ncbi:MAG: copper amine oxidase N-terminal domain-containing protein, partial [Armatimonadetes bacterium]|nr:copper amine oxidase N-terminal domain-containing protein [Armatimonadota bacterium]
MAQALKRSLFGLAALVAFLGTARCVAQPGPGASATATGGPYIILDEQPWQPTRPPVRMLGHTLAPAREILTAIGCTTVWDPKTRSLTATKDQRVLKIWVGKTTASVDGQPHELPLAATVVGDTTYIPLQTVAEVFGGELSWDPATETATLSFVPQGRRIAGTLTQILSGPPRAIVIFETTTSRYHALAVPATAKITLRRTGGALQQATVGDLRLGDWVVAVLDENDQVRTLAGEYKQVEGTVQQSEGGTVLLEDGTALRLMDMATLVDAGGKPAPPDMLGPGAVIRARVNPVTGEAGWIVLLTPA